MPAAQAIAILLPKLATTSFRVPAAGGGELTVGAANVLANTINNAITLFSVQEGPPATGTSDNPTLGKSIGTVIVF